MFRMTVSLQKYNCFAQIKKALRARRPRQSLVLTDLERVMGIEPTPQAWEAGVLPLNYTRMAMIGAKI
jgi:hypothetical protein